MANNPSGAKEAGKAFVGLYLKDVMFRRDLAADKELFFRTLDELGRMDVDTSAIDRSYESLGRVEASTLGQAVEGTRLLTAETDRLDAAIKRVLSRHKPEDPIGFNADRMDDELGEGLEATGGSVVRGGAFGAGSLAMQKLLPKLAGSAAAGGQAMTSMAASAGSLSAALGPVAIAAAVAAPALAAIDDETSGALSKSGLYPKWLKGVGDAMLTLSPPLKIAAAGLHALWDVIKLGKSIIGPFVKVGLVPLRIATAAMVAPFRAVSLAVDSVYLPFRLARKAIDGTRAAITALPRVSLAAGKGLRRLTGAAVSSAKGLGRLAKSAASTAWAGATKTYHGIAASIRGIGSAAKWSGKRLMMLGAGATALGAMITVPLTRAAKKFAEYGNNIRTLTQRYRELGLGAKEMSVYAYMASQATGELAELSESERIDNLMRSTKVGSAAFREWTKQAQAAGAVMSGPGLSAAHALTVAYGRMKGSLAGLWRQLGQAVAPAISSSTELMVGAIRGVTGWVKENRQLIATVFKVAGAVGAAGTAIAAAGGALVTLGTAISPLTALLATIAGGMAVVEYKTGAARSVVDAYSGSVVKLYNTITTNLKPILAEAQRVFGGVTDAIKGGDLKLAARIAWSGFRIAWSEGLLWLSDRTTGVFSGILANLAGGNWKAAADGAMGAVSGAWLRMQQTVDNVWSDIRDVLDRGWVFIVNGFDTAVTSIRMSWMKMIAAVKDAMKDWLKWTYSSVITPMAVAMSNMLPDDSVAERKLKTKLTSVERTIDATLKKIGSTDVSQEVEEEERRSERRAQLREMAADMRKQGRDDAYVMRYLERETAIQEAEERGTQQAKGRTQEETKLLRAELKLQLERAEAIKLAGQQPGELPFGEPAKLSGLVTSSSFAFGQFGGAAQKDPAENMVKELRAQRTENRDARKVLTDLSQWLSANPNLVETIKNWVPPVFSET